MEGAEILPHNSNAAYEIIREKLGHRNAIYDDLLEQIRKTNALQHC